MMDANVQKMPVVDENNIVADMSMTNARHAYNLLQKNGLMGGCSRLTKEKVEILCSEKLDGVIPSMFKSAFDYPSPVERAVYNLVLCQYAKSKLISVSGDISKVKEAQNYIDELVKKFSEYYATYLQVKDHPVELTKNSFKPEAHYDFKDKRFKVDSSFDTSVTKSNEDLVKSFKEMESLVIEAKKIYSKISRHLKIDEITLFPEAVEDFGARVSEIAGIVAATIEEENSRRVFGKDIRYFFSFKGSWANEEIILALSKI